MRILKYKIIQICKSGNKQIYMQKNIDAKNVKDYVKKVNIYIYISNRNVNKEKQIYIEMSINI